LIGSIFHRTPNRSRDIKAATFVVALALSSSISGQLKSPLPLATASSSVGEQSPPTADLMWKKLDARVGKMVLRFDGVMGVAIVDLTDGRMISHNADRVFPTASSIKIAILLELYHEEQEARAGAQAKAKLDDVYNFDPKELVEFSQIMAGLTPGVTRVTNRDLAQFMIAVSDNTAANILIDRVGKDNVNAMLRSLGLTKTMLRRKMMDFVAAKRGDENVSTPQEMAQLLAAIYKGKLLNKELSEQLIKQLSTLKESYIPHDLPGGVQVANKPGKLQNVRTDSGIVFVKDRPFAMSVMTSNARDERAAERAISQIALEAYRCFDMRSKTSH
jgi:beta-lactamase class A